MREYLPIIHYCCTAAIGVLMYGWHHVSSQYLMASLYVNGVLIHISPFIGRHVVYQYVKYTIGWGFILIQQVLLCQFSSLIHKFHK